MSRRPSSPTNTSYSGISNYRSDTYRPLRDLVDPVPKLPDILDSRQIAKQHYDELQGFLATHLAKEPVNSRSSAREKLTRLTKQQFQELSTDVYDELIRRNNNSEQNEVPFLPVRNDFHPKRNQARQKLATLPKTRFKDLSSDVFYELGRRYPEFKEPEVMGSDAETNYDDNNEKPRRPSIDALRESESSYSRSNSLDNTGRKGSTDSIGEPRRGTNAERVSPYPNGSIRRPSEDTARPSGGGSIRRPSEDTIRTYQGRGSKESNTLPSSLYRKPSQDANSYAASVAPSTSTSGMVIPAKSTITEEEIQVPYGKDDDDTRDFDSDSAPSNNRTVPANQRSDSGAFGLGNSLLQTPLSPGTDDDLNERRGQDFFDQTSRASMASTGSALAGARGTREEREQMEQMRSEYEFKIATMQNRILTLETELESAGQSRGSDAQRDVEALQVRVEDQAAVIRSLQREVDDAKAARDEEARQRKAEAERQNEYEAQVRELQGRIEDMEANGVTRHDSDAAAEDLRAEMQNLVDELKDLSQRNDELLADKDSDQAAIYSLTTQLKDAKKKYDRAKTELRNFKATSQLFAVQSPKMDETLPISDTGGILDVHVTSFQTAVDNLLAVSRSNQPSGVLSPMRSVVNTAAAINEDLRTFEHRSARERQGVDEESIRLIRERIDATLSNLVAAIKNHATSHGLSPVSLVDAAASHVSAAVVTGITTVMMRKATVMERERDRQQQQMSESMSPLAMSPRQSGRNGSLNGHSGGMRGLGNLKNSDNHGRTSSETSQWSNGSPLNRPGRSTMSQAAVSDRSSNPSPQPPPIFDTPTLGANGTSEEGGSDEAWEELKPYLDAQSESIILPIRNLLSSTRAGAPASDLDEHLTQIITIVSSIVAVCKGSLPSGSIREGEEILRQLGENCDKLSELQTQGEVTKQTRQAMASSSFAVAKAMKELRALGST